LGYEKRFHTAWVKRRKTRGEQMFSALLPNSDIDVWHLRSQVAP